MSLLKHKQSGFTIVELLIVIVVIAILAAITIVSFNGVINSARESAFRAEITQWKRSSEVYKIDRNIECPPNYVFVYGNATLGTSDFCIMKYEAKKVGSDDGSGTYNAAWVPESRPTGTPWINIAQTDAIAEAQTACAGCHLVTEAEWMTIAADVLSVKYNWSGGEVGKGYVFTGHVNVNPSAFLAASGDDDDGLFGITGGTGDGAQYNTRRTLYLKSGDAIWDLSGNAYDLTSGTMTGAQPGPIGTAAWREYSSIAAWGNMPSGSRPSALAAVPGLSGITSWGSGQGIGMIYSSASADPAYVAAFRRGGNYGNPLRSGILAVPLDNAPSTVGTNNSNSFRAAR